MTPLDRSGAEWGVAGSAPAVPPDLRALLDLEQLDQGVFQADRNGQPVASRAFGGAVAAQSLAAAARTLPAGRPVHSLHAYFLRPADPHAKIVYRVDALRDGGSFTARRVTAGQHGETIFTMSASFHAPEGGFAHQLPRLAAPAPADLPPLPPARDEPARAWFDRISRRHPFQLRIHGELARMATTRGERAAPRQGFWFRAALRPLSDDPLLHRCAITYASDMLLLSSSLGPHRVVVESRGLQFASLDHAVWFHAPARADEWLYYDQESMWAGGSRALCTGRMFDRSGTLVASVVQEGLIRYRPPNKRR